MRKKEFVKKGLSLTLALAIGIGGIPLGGLSGTAFVYAAEQDTSVDSTIAVKSAKKITVSGGKLVTYREDGKQQKTKLAASVALADPKATEQTKKIYAYLKRSAPPKV